MSLGKLILHNKKLSNRKNCPINKQMKYLFFVLNEFVNFDQHIRIFLEFSCIYERNISEENSTL